MKKIVLGTALCMSFFTISCTNEVDMLIENNDNFLDIREDICADMKNDSIVEIVGNIGMKKTPKIRTYSYDDDMGLDGIKDMPVKLVIKQNPFEKRFLTFKGKNLECKLENEEKDKDGLSNQKFFLKTMPLTGLFYFTPQKEPECLLSSGTYSSNPEVPVLYVKSSTNTTGATWDIKRGNSDNRSFVLYNEDLLEQGSGGWMDVYNLALGVNTNNGNLNFSKYNKLKTQEFEIRPCDEFVITELLQSQYAQSEIINKPDDIIEEEYENNSSLQQQMSTKIVRKAQRTSSFNRKTALTYNVSTSVKVGAFFASGRIETSVGGNNEWTYGESETKNDEREYNFPLVIAPYTKIKVSIIITMKEARINYRAKMHGINTGYDIWEEGVWENVDCSNIRVKLEEYDLRTGKLTGRTKLLDKIPTVPTGIN